MLSGGERSPWYERASVPSLQSERIHERGELLAQSHHSHLKGDSGVSPPPRKVRNDPVLPPHHSQLKGDSGVSPPPPTGLERPFSCRPTTPFLRETAGCRPPGRGSNDQSHHLDSGSN